MRRRVRGMRLRLAWLSPLLRAVAEAECEESDCVGEEGDYHREPPLLYVADVFDDCCYGGDSAEDGEYWDHGDSPLLRVVVLSGIFSDIQLYAKPVPKGKCCFLSKNHRVEKLD